MTDRELLELVAKAHGFIDDATNNSAAHGLHRSEEGEFYVVDDLGWNPWAPQDNEGQALRLAVKLKISIEHPNPADLGGGYVVASVHSIQYKYLFLKKTRFTEAFDGDPYAATLRAIVRAAAAIGEKL